MFPPELPASAHQQPQNTQALPADPHTVQCPRSWVSVQPARGCALNTGKSQITGSNRPASSKDRVGSGEGRGRRDA